MYVFICLILSNYKKTRLLTGHVIICLSLSYSHTGSGGRQPDKLSLPSLRKDIYLDQNVRK